ncbi:hypothetical protein ACFL5H_00375 [Candidatus Latescibacterota bacterium]
MIVVEIESTQVLTNGLAIEDVLTNQPNIASFMLTDPDTEPVPGQEVSIYRDSTENMLFGGVIVQVSKMHPAPGSARYAVQCTDCQRFLDRELVFEVYEDMTCKAVIEALIASYTNPGLGFTTTNVQDGPTIAKAVFNYQPVSQCIRELAELTGYDWYVDDARDIHFFEKETAAAPFALNDAVLAALVDNYQIIPDYSQVRNRVYVRGGYTLSDPYTEVQTAEADQTVFKLGYKPHNLSMTVGGTPKTVGIEFLDDEASFDYMMNYQESTVRVATGGSAPGAGAVLSFIYEYEVPILVLVQDHASQQAIAALEGGSGIYEHVIVDNTIRSKEEAYNRGQSEMSHFANPWVTGTFTTHEHGFRSGQTITVDITGERYNGSYQIRSVTATSQGNNILVYTVTFATTLYDLVDVLAGLIREQRRVNLREDEIVDRLELVNETVAIGESHTATLSAHPTKWGTKKWGTFTWA